MAALRIDVVCVTDHNHLAGTAEEPPGTVGSDAHDPDGVGAAYLEMPDFDGPASFLDALHEAEWYGEYRPHARRYGPDS